MDKTSSQQVLTAWIKELIKLSRLGLLYTPEIDSYATEFVNQFCSQLAIRDRQLGRMSGWYVFEDKRPGTAQENFEADAADYFEYQKMFRV